MKLIKKEVSLNHKIYLLSDLHIGSKHTCVEKIKEVVQRIKNEKSAYCILLGDIIEAITVDDERFNIETNDERIPLPLEQIYFASDLLQDIKDRIICILSGNHEQKLSRYGNLIWKILCKELNTEYGTYTCKISMLNKKNNSLLYKLYATHGYGVINSRSDDYHRRIANMKLSLKRKLCLKSGDCEIMCMGHTHKLLCLEPLSNDVYIYDDGDKIHQAIKPKVVNHEHRYIPEEQRWYINAGTFMRLFHEGVSGYAEVKGYDPTDIGYAVVVVRNGNIKRVDLVTI